MFFEAFSSPSHLFFILASLLEDVPQSISGDEKKNLTFPTILLDLAGGWSNPVHESPTFQISVEPPLCCSQCSLDAETGRGARIETRRLLFRWKNSKLYFAPAKAFYTSTASVENHQPERTQTSLSITDHKEALLSVRGSEGS